MQKNDNTPLDKYKLYHYYVYTNFGSLETGRAASEDTQQVGVVWW